MNANKETYQAMFNGLQGRKQKEVRAALKAFTFRGQAIDVENSTAVYALDEDLDLGLEWDPTTGRINAVIIDEIIPR